MHQLALTHHVVVQTVGPIPVPLGRLPGQPWVLGYRPLKPNVTANGEGVLMAGPGGVLVPVNPSSPPMLDGVEYSDVRIIWPEQRATKAGLPHGVLTIRYGADEGRRSELNGVD
jgi:hypothetical protein